MTHHQQHLADDRTLQDDRAELAADPGEGSPLTEGEGAPLAEDGAAGAQDAPGVLTQSLLGGAFGISSARSYFRTEPRATPGARAMARMDCPSVRSS